MEFLQFPSSGKKDIISYTVYALLRSLFFLIIAKSLLALGYLFMNELQQAVAQFYPSGGMAGSGGSNSGGNMGGSSGGSGWTPFDLGVLAGDANEEGEEVAQPTAPANPVEAIPQEPDMDSVKEVMRPRKDKRPWDSFQIDGKEELIRRRKTLIAQELSDITERVFHRSISYQKFRATLEKMLPKDINSTEIQDLYNEVQSMRENS